MSQTALPRLLLTAGEPAGIGPELCLKMAQHSWQAAIVVCADIDLLRTTARSLGLAVTINEWHEAEPLPAQQPDQLYCRHVPLAAPAIAGQLDARNGYYVLQTLALAADLVQQNTVDAIVTAPVHKGIINDAGHAFTGHTEFFADRASSDSVMMLACPEFRVALVTTHLPLRDVPDAITTERLRRIISLLHADLVSKYGIAEPCIHVCGLNPHAGEGGHLGMEEIEVIEPLLTQMRSEGYNLVGPLPADTALTPKGMQGADVTLAMYHDQGLSVLKYAGFGAAVNVTLGLPFIRVSVDHGTALDLAGKGTADKGSMEAAMKEAIMMASS
jgi:4-hydroxythreonine-4-phosphate dehydrogenase